MYLLDINVLSAGAPNKTRANPGLVEWMDRNSDRLYLSVVTIAEVEDGIAKARREGAARKARALAEWLATILHLYSARVFPLDIAAARALGSLSDRARASGYAPGFADLAVAATAHTNRCTILTRNLGHFRMLDVPVHDPFDSLPGS